MLILRSANVDECAALSELCMRSKAMWGYDAPFMEACRAELTITAGGLDRIQIAEIDGRIAGVAEVIQRRDDAVLEKLFIDPVAIRSGVGRKLFDWVKHTAIAGGAKMLIIESDPQAADFYRCMGAIDDGTVASKTISGRMIPRLKLRL